MFFFPKSALFLTKAFLKVTCKSVNLSKGKGFEYISRDIRYLCQNLSYIRLASLLPAPSWMLVRMRSECD